VDSDGGCEALWGDATADERSVARQSVAVLVRCACEYGDCVGARVKVRVEAA